MSSTSPLMPHRRLGNAHERNTEGQGLAKKLDTGQSCLTRKVQQRNHGPRRRAGPPDGKNDGPSGRIDAADVKLVSVLQDAAALSVSRNKGAGYAFNPQVSRNDSRQPFLIEIQLRLVVLHFDEANFARAWNPIPSRAHQVHRLCASGTNAAQENPCEQHTADSGMQLLAS